MQSPPFGVPYHPMSRVGSAPVPRVPAGPSSLRVAVYAILAWVLFPLLGVAALLAYLWFQSLEPRAVTQQFIDAVNDGEFERARRHMADAESVDRTEFAAFAHRTPFRRTRELSLSSYNYVQANAGRVVCIGGTVDGEPVQFDLIPARGTWKIRSIDDPHDCTR